MDVHILRHKHLLGFYVLYDGSRWIVGCDDMIWADAHDAIHDNASLGLSGLLYCTVRVAALGIIRA